jgi:hypothetical protein
MFSTIVQAGTVGAGAVGTGAVGAGAETGAASRHVSGSDQMMRLLAAPTPQHCHL